MIKDVFHPQFNIVNVPSDERVDCLNQVMDARDNGIVTHNEALDIVCSQWYIQHKTSKLINVHGVKWINPTQRG